MRFGPAVKKPVKKILLGFSLACFGVLVIIGGIYASLSVYRTLHPYVDREISGPIVISPDWVEIAPKNPLRAELVVQQVVIYVQRPIKESRDSWELILPDGSKVIPEVQLIDEQGNVYDLTEPSGTQNPHSVEAFQRGFSNRTLPKDKVYKSVRVRSAKPVSVLKVVWRCYDPRDIK